ncbi:MAG: Holliday junction resolvase RuvX [Clostridia bacterium]
MSRALAIDYGDVRVGLAITDELNLIASGIDTLVINYDDNILLKYISQLLKKYDINCFVIGYPKNMDGTKSIKLDKIDEVIEKLKIFNIDIIKIDERLTTVSAYRTMRDLNISQKHKNKVADKLAAIYILETYMQRIKN